MAAGSDEGPLWQAVYAIVLLVAMLVAMAREVAPPDMLMMLTLVLFLLADCVGVDDAVGGFSNKGMLSVAVLFIVAAGIEKTGAVDPVRRVLEKFTMRKDQTPRPLNHVIFVVTLPISMLSAFLNNTPVVAMMITVLQKLGQKIHVSPSKLLIPLSYASILGGTCTLIGTSTNLVVIGLAEEQIEGFSMGLFEIGKVGLPVMLFGICYMMVMAPRFLPNRLGLTDVLERPKEYITALLVKTANECENETPLEGKTIAQAGLRNLENLFIVQIERSNGDVLNAPGPETVLQSGDKLLFAGVVSSVLSLAQVRGLKAIDEEDDEEQVDLAKISGDDILVEAVIAPRSAMVHRTVREVKFRTKYHAAIVAVHRHGQRIREKIGSIELQAGDTLLMVTNTDFLQHHRNQEHFALVSQVDGQLARRTSKAPIAVLLALAMISLTVAEVIDLLTAALCAAAGMIMTRCITAQEARRAINLEVLIVIAAAFGISKGLINSGAAQLIAKGLVAAADPSGLAGLYIVVYTATMLFSAAVTNNAAITIMFPVALQAANDVDADFMPFLYLLMMGASASFLTPTGYQTNLMVQGVGGYTFMDFVYFGGPLQLFLGVITVSIVVTMNYWWVWLLIGIACLGIAGMLSQNQDSYSLPRVPSRRSRTQLEVDNYQEVYYYQPDLGLSPMEEFDSAPPMDLENTNTVTIEGFSSTD